MEGYELSTVENSHYASRLEAFMPNGEETVLCHKPEYAVVQQGQQGLVAKLGAR